MFTMFRFSMLLLGLACATGCLSSEGIGLARLGPDHCRLPDLSTTPAGDRTANEWWRPGPLDVASTIAWPDCPPLDASTATVDDPLRITYPAREGQVAPGRWPVIVFAHANAVDVCDPTDRYRSLHEQWASWGWIVVAVDASEHNCTAYSIANMRGRIDKHVAALDELRRANADVGSPFRGHVDLDRVVVAGHSRGGTVALVLASESPDFVGAIALQAGNPARFGLGNEFIDLPVIGLTSELDKDLDFPHVDLTEATLRGRYSWHTLRRGNHSFTADGLPRRVSDDPAEILGRASQIELTKYLTTAFLAANFGVWDGRQIAKQPQAGPVLYSHFGAEFARGFLRGSGFVSRWDLPDRDVAWVDEFDSRAVGLPPLASDDDEHEEEEEEGEGRRSWRDDPDINDLGGANTCSGLARCEEVWTYRPELTDAARAGYRVPSSLLLEASTDAPGRFEMELDVDAAEGWHLQGRVRTDADEAPRFDIVLTTAAGEQRVMGREAVDNGGVGDRFVQFDVEVQPGHVDAVAFELQSGRLFVDDVRFVASSAP